MVLGSRYVLVSGSFRLALDSERRDTMILMGEAGGPSAGPAVESGLRLDGFFVLLKTAPSRGPADRFCATMFEGSGSMMLMVEHKQKRVKQNREGVPNLDLLFKKGGGALRVAGSDGHLVTGRKTQ